MYKNIALSQNLSHPRVYITNTEKESFKKSLEDTSWKRNFVEEKIEKVEEFLRFSLDDPDWLVSRLQMNWKTKHDKVFLKSGDFSHSTGEAPVPTVRFSGTRDWASDYIRPKLEDIVPFFDDPRGFFLKNRASGEMEWVHPSETGFLIDKTNEQIMSIAADAAFLYWFTGEEKYAELAAPVFLTYMEGMYYRDAPIDLENGGQQEISGLATFEVIHEGIVVSLVTAYDFLHNYLMENDIELGKSIAVFQKWGDQIIKNGIPDNNWNLFQARFLTYIALVLDDNDSYENGKGRQYFLDHTFTTSTDRQLAISESLLEYDPETGMWPESPSYSVHVITTLLRLFTLLDHSTDKNELNHYGIVEKAALASFQYLFPNGYTIGFGDSNHKPLPPENFELLIANYHKYKEHDKEKLMSSLLEQMIEDGLYQREARNLFQLFFYVDSLEVNKDTEAHSEENLLITPTFYAPNVSMFNQRMGSGDEAIMASVVGSYGNHAHANGISLELFANNYAIGPDMGKGPSYWHNTHRSFYSRFPAHNTVVVDRSSDYAAMRSKHPNTLENSFPASGEIPAFNKITYAQVSFVEPKTISSQKRFTALIKSHLPSGRGYVVDVFRSMKQGGGKQLHEYIYHNLGQSLNLFNDKGKPMVLESTDELNSKHGELKGFDFFSDQAKVETDDDVRALFKIEDDGSKDNLMKVWIKGNEKQTIYSVKSPPSNAISKGTAPESLLDELMPTFILSRPSESWQSPFALIFNPYFEGEENPINDVKYSSLDEYAQTQVIEIELSDKKTTDKIILNVSENDIATNTDFYQKGLLSVCRNTGKDDGFSFLFLSGMNSFKKDGWEISASGKSFTAVIEKSEMGYAIHSDQPIKVILPHPMESELPEIRLYNDGTITYSRKARRSRHNEEQVIFNIDKEYEKVELSFSKKNLK